MLTAILVVMLPTRLDYDAADTDGSLRRTSRYASGANTDHVTTDAMQRCAFAASSGSFPGRGSLFVYQIILGALLEDYFIDLGYSPSAAEVLSIKGVFYLTLTNYLGGILNVFALNLDDCSVNPVSSIRVGSRPSSIAFGQHYQPD